MGALSGGHVMRRPSFSAKLPPTKPKNTDRRAREYLTPAEVERLIGAARKVGRHGHRDATLLLLMYRHGLRVAEVSRLRWEHIDVHAALLHVRRLKHGVSSVHPLHGPELRALRRLKTADLGGAYDPPHGQPSGRSRRLALSGPSAYAAARLRLLLGQQEHRYAHHSTLPGASQYSAYRPVHGTCAAALSGLLGRLTGAS
jgi:integrase